jgi:hypothetical protein
MASQAAAIVTPIKKNPVRERRRLVGDSRFGIPTKIATNFLIAGGLSPHPANICRMQPSPEP